VGESLFGIQEAKDEWRGSLDSFGRATARGRDGVEVGGAVAQEALCGSRPAESLVGPEARVVGEEERKAPLEIDPQKGRSCRDLRDCLQGQKEALDEGDGARLADGSIAVAHSVVREGLSERLRGELGTLVGDGVAGRAEPARRAGEEVVLG
jgi:hypothetical protein